MKPKWTLHSMAYIYQYLLLADPTLNPTLKPHPHTFIQWRNWQRKHEETFWTAAVQPFALSPGLLHLQTQNTLFLCFCMCVYVCVSAWVWVTEQEPSNHYWNVCFWLLAILDSYTVHQLLSDGRLFKPVWMQIKSLQLPHDYIKNKKNRLILLLVG